jgi:hypothetical protein
MNTIHFICRFLFEIPTVISLFGALLFSSGFDEFEIVVVAGTDEESTKYTILSRNIFPRRIRSTFEI